MVKSKCYNNYYKSYLIRLCILILFSTSIFDPAFAQGLKNVKGTVRDGGGGVLPGVKVAVQKTDKAVSTDVNGNYSIQALSTDVIVFSYIGMVSKQISVGTKTTIDVILLEDNKVLNEVVVIGYGTVKKKDLTGSVGQVNMEDLSKAPVSSFAEALAGRVAGVQVSASDGQPGGGINIVIRGAGSLTQSTSPLYVIDGFPVEDPDPASLNPEEIESMTILKDASSTAIYGSRAANGVVLIQTKRGKIGEPVVSISSSVGFYSTPPKVDLMSPYEFIKYQTELNPNLGTTRAFFAYNPTLGREKTLEDYRDAKGINFQDYVMGTGSVQIYNLALRGGTEQTKYSISGSLFDQKGTIVNTGLNRYSGKITIDQTISKKIKVGLIGGYSSFSQSGQVINQQPDGQYTSPTAYVLARTWMYRPISGNIDDDLLGEDFDDDAISAADFRINPYTDVSNQHQITKTNLLEANGFLSYEITPTLQFKTMGGIRRRDIYAERFFNSKTSQGGSSPNNPNGINGSVRNSLLNVLSNENTLNYKETFNKDHTVSALALFSINSSGSSSNGYGGRLLPNENLGIAGIDEGVSYNPNFTPPSENTMVSYGTRLEYNYKSKYIVTGTFRSDGSSKFLKHWGYFPGVALAWNMQKEGFFAKALPAVSTSKLRASYGSTGNNRVGDYDTQNQLSQTLDGYSFNNATPLGAIYVSAVGNRELKWEKVNTLDFGYEIGLFKDRINLEVDVYQKTSEDLLLNADLPPTTGYSTAIQNVGKLRNEGLELTLNTTNISSKNFTWQSSFNISFNKNKIMALNRGVQSLRNTVSYVSQFNRPLYMSEIGQSAGMMIGFIWEGNYQYEDFNETSPGVYLLKPSVASNGTATRSDIKPGDIKYRDMNGDGTMSDADITVIGRGVPIHTGGFSNNFQYKSFSLNVFFQWSYGNDIFNANRLLLEGNSNGYANINQFASYVNRWSPDNQTNENYRTGGGGPIGFFSSRVVEDGSYLRLKTVSLAYSIPQKFIKVAYLSNLSLNVSAQNLITWTNYSGMDPEVSTRNASNGNVLTPGFDYSSYPKSPTVVFGLKASF